MIYTTVKEKGDVRIVKLLVENILFNNHEEIFNKIKTSISEEFCFIVLDAERVEFMDSLSIGMLVPLLLYSKRMGGGLAVASPRKNIRELFEILRLDKIIPVFDDVDAAVASFE
jgi:anti-sigma B factor antagonist